MVLFILVPLIAQDTFSIVAVDPTTGTVTSVVDKSGLAYALEAVGIHGQDAGVNLEGGIVAAPDGTIYAVSDNPENDPQYAGVIFAIDPVGTATVVVAAPPWVSLDVSITLAPNGDLIVADDGDAHRDCAIWRIDPGDGTPHSARVDSFLLDHELAATVGGAIDLEGGIGFDSAGNFYIAENATDQIYTWPAVDPDVGSIDPAAGEVFVSKA